MGKKRENDSNGCTHHTLRLNQSNQGREHALWGGVVTLIAVLTDTPPDVLTSTTYEYLVSCVMLRYVSET